MIVTAYHGSNVPIRHFSARHGAQGVIWFTEDKDKIVRGDSGASSSAYVMKVLLRVDKAAGWAEYERYCLGEVRRLGFDSIHLDDDWVIFDGRRVKVVGIWDRQGRPYR